MDAHTRSSSPFKNVYNCLFFICYEKHVFLNQLNTKILSPEPTTYFLVTPFFSPVDHVTYPDSWRGQSSGVLDVIPLSL